MKNKESKEQINKAYSEVNYDDNDYLLNNQGNDAQYIVNQIVHKLRTTVLIAICFSIIITTGLLLILLVISNKTGVSTIIPGPEKVIKETKTITQTVPAPINNYSVPHTTNQQFSKPTNTTKESINPSMQPSVNPSPSNPQSVTTTSSPSPNTTTSPNNNFPFPFPFPSIIPNEESQNNQTSPGAGITTVPEVR